MKNNDKQIVTLSPEDVTLSEQNLFNEKQIGFLLKSTPKKYLKTRKGKGGEMWTYVSGSYIIKVLNILFAWDWDFKVIKYDFDLKIGQCFVLGELNVPGKDGRRIIKQQFGRCDVKFLKRPNADGSRQPLDLGNDLKAASTDAMKKCASLIGIAADVYGGEDFREVQLTRKEQVVDEGDGIEKKPEEIAKLDQRFLSMLNEKKSREEVRHLIEHYLKHTGAEELPEELSDAVTNHILNLN